MQRGHSPLPDPQALVRDFYRTLAQAWGPQHWWPAESSFEVVVGAFLTQNTSWTNVERAIANLRAADALTVEALRLIQIDDLEQLIRPSGYFRQKAQRLKTFISFLDLNYDGSLEHMFAQQTSKLREELLALKGVGPETADSILLYAGNHPVFVVDAYTRRVFERHGLISETATYEDTRQLVESALVTEEAPVRPRSRIGGSAHDPSPMSTKIRSATAQAYNEMHALIVGLGKNQCLKTAAKCEGCPLAVFLPPCTGERSPFPNIPL